MLLNNSEQNETFSDSAIWERIETLCVQRGWNIGRLAEIANVSRTTLHNWQQGKTNRPQNATIFKLAEALEIDPAKLLESQADLPSSLQPGSLQPVKLAEQLFDAVLPVTADSSRSFDRQTNWSIQAVCTQFPHLFELWSEEDWDELFSSFGTGGELNEAGVREQAEAINLRKETIYQLQVVLETHLAEAARGIIRSLYDSVQDSNAVPTAVQ